MCGIPLLCSLCLGVCTFRKFGTFSSLSEVGLMEEDTPKYLNILCNLVVEFDHRFEDFCGNTTAFELFSHPFSTDAVSEELQMELLELQSDSNICSKFRELPLPDFYRCVPAHRYGKIHKHAQVMLSLFGSTYVCEQAFSLMNLNESKLRNALSDSHLHDILTLSVGQLEPDIEKPRTGFMSRADSPKSGTECVGLGLQCVTLEYVLLCMINNNFNVQ